MTEHERMLYWVVGYLEGIATKERNHQDAVNKIKEMLSYTLKDAHPLVLEPTRPTEVSTTTLPYPPPSQPRPPFKP